MKLEKAACKKYKGQTVTSGRYHRFEVRDDCKVKLSLGNLSDAGWYWDGEGDQLLGFLIRLDSMTQEDERNAAFENLDNGIKYKDLKPLLLDSAKKKDGLYELSGDNRLWKFGEGAEEDEYSLNDYIKEKLPESKHGLTKEILDDYYTHADYGKRDYDTFEKQHGKEYVKEVQGCIKSSNNMSDLMECIAQRKDSWYEDGVMHAQETDYKALDNAIKKIGGK